jgi:hypothetical protein
VKQTQMPIRACIYLFVLGMAVVSRICGQASSIGLPAARMYWSVGGCIASVRLVAIDTSAGLWSCVECTIGVVMTTKLMLAAILQREFCLPNKQSER